jgi:hypothetical protein
MNKFTQEIANILQAQIENQPYEIQQSGLTLDQIEEISRFARGFSRSASFPFPLKTR